MSKVIAAFKLAVYKSFSPSSTRISAADAIVQLLGYSKMTQTTELLKLAVELLPATSPIFTQCIRSRGHSLEMFWTSSHSRSTLVALWRQRHQGAPGSRARQFNRQTAITVPPITLTLPPEISITIH